MGQILGIYGSSSEEETWKSLTKYKDAKLVYIRDKNRNYWIGDKLDRLDLPLIQREPIEPVGLKDLNLGVDLRHCHFQNEN